MKEKYYQACEALTEALADELNIEWEEAEEILQERIVSGQVDIWDYYRD